MTLRRTILSVLLCAAGLSAAAPDGMAFVPSGVFQPFFKSTPPSPIRAFFLDRTQVTNAAYLEFLQANPVWRKDSVKKLFADAGYLRSWTGDTFPREIRDVPVTGVSFFAARAYCAWRKKRLPLLGEWEYAAGADVKHPMTDAENARVLGWYANPGTGTPGMVGQTRNIHGVYDMHGLVWEWVADFNSVLLSEESRETGSDKEMFCGGGAANASNFRNYAAFMRYAFRSSLRSNYTGANLGFRCAADL